MDELEESARKWEAYFEGKPYKPKKPPKVRINYNNSRTATRISPFELAVFVTQPSAFNHLTEPFLIQIGNEIMEVDSKHIHTRSSVEFQVSRGIADTPIGWHNRGTRVRIVPIHNNSESDIPI